MQLNHREVPVEFLSAMPEGIKYVQKKGKDFLVVEQLYCKKGHSLMAEDMRMHGEPSICIKIKIGLHKGLIYIDAFWGSHDKLYSFLPADSAKRCVTEAYCPECGEPLMIDRKCEDEMCGCHHGIVMLLPGGLNHIVICGRHGCFDHEMVVQELPRNISRKIQEINYFGEFHDDMFEGI